MMEDSAAVGLITKTYYPDRSKVQKGTYYILLCKNEGENRKDICTYYYFQKE